MTRLKQRHALLDNILFSSVLKKPCVAETGWKIISDTLSFKIKLEPVFVKHYAPNICLSLNMAKFAVS